MVTVEALPGVAAGNSAVACDVIGDEVGGAAPCATAVAFIGIGSTSHLPLTHRIQVHDGQQPAEVVAETDREAHEQVLAAQECER